MNPPDTVLKYSLHNCLENAKEKEDYCRQPFEHMRLYMYVWRILRKKEDYCRQPWTHETMSGVRKKRTTVLYVVQDHRKS